MSSESLPRQLGRYRLLSHIGEGGMGAVYRAELVLDGGAVRACAVKVILPHRQQETTVRAMFEREASLASRIRDENVVDVLDTGNDPASGAPFLVMEFVDGVTLRALAEHAWQGGGALRVDHVCSVIADVARGLAAIHALVDADGAPMRVVHRDVTPENVLVSRDGTARIGDFGIALSKDAVRLTQAGGLTGKTPYLSPEQLDGGEITAASDVFSLGVMFSFLLTGRRPFDRATELATMNAIVDDEFPTMSHERPELPREVSAIARAMLDKDPARRPTATDVARSLADVIALAARPDPRPGSLVDAMLGPRDPLAAAPLQTQVVSLDAAERGRLHTIAATPATLPPTLASHVPASTAEQRRRSMLAGAAAAVVVLVVALVAQHAESCGGVPRSMTLSAPPTFAWKTTDGALLGRGVVEVPLPPSTTSVVAFDAAGMTCSVAVREGEARIDDNGTGVLDVRVRPWARVVIDGAAVGTTPLRTSRLRAGCDHTIELVGRGRSVVRVVHIDRDTTARLDVDLE